MIRLIHYTRLFQDKERWGLLSNTYKLTQKVKENEKPGKKFQKKEPDKTSEKAINEIRKVIYLIKSSK